MAWPVLLTGSTAIVAFFKTAVTGRTSDLVQGDVVEDGWMLLKV